jgi:hypothetical protein
MRLQDMFSYNYELQNQITSEQKINEFIFDAAPDSILNNRCMDNWIIGGVSGKGFGWILLPGFHNFLAQGKSNSSFYFECNRLPAIAQCFIRGENGNRVPMRGDSIDFNLDRWYDDVRENSFKIFTVAPKKYPTPFVPLNFLDTLSSYATQSRSLGWIKDQTTADKYLGYFNSAKTSLQQNNITSSRATLNQVLQDVNIDSTNNITSEAYALLRYNTEYLLAQLPTAPISGCNVKLVNSSGVKLTGGALQYYDGSWKDAVNNSDGTFFVNTTKTTLSLRMTYEYASQTKSNVPVGQDTVVFQTVNAQVQLQSSNGVLIDTGTVQYYAGAWRGFGTTTNGIAAKELLPVNYSFRMAYAYASKDKQQDLNINPTVVFQTVNAAVQLQNSQGNLIDEGTVQYYSGAWRPFGTISSGPANKELLPNTYSFRITYAYASKDKQQDIGTNPVVVFQTVNASVQLQNSQGNLIDQGTIQYYSGAWREFGVTSNGVANKELLPNNYSFRMTYAYASKDKQQDLSTNPTVVFQTVNAAVQLKNSQGNLMPAPSGDQGTVQYYSGAWRTFGTTSNGIAAKELLPNTYSFRMTYEYASIDKQQDLSANSTVDFSTVLCTIRVKNAQSQPVDGATASYYSGAWRQIGNTVNGEITKELLPLNLSFRIKYGTQQQDKQQNISTNNIVEFSLP